MTRHPPDLGFLFIGGLHQALHMAPVALALARRGVAVTAYAPPADVTGLATLFEQLDTEAHLSVVSLAQPGWARAARALLGGRGEKPLSLIAWRRRLLRHDALVAAERTSTLLKRWPGRRPVMLHLPHGSGDRAVGFERRIALFDHLFVSGDGVRERMIVEGLATPDRIDTIGAVKVAALLARPAPSPLFAGDRSVVLYNPHFDMRLSSWPIAGNMIDAIVADGRFDLIVAPHVRLGQRLPPRERAIIEARTSPHCHVDFGSAASSDMSYIRAADIYLGDVSSQVYEFLHRPAPVVFANAHNVAWAGDPNYRMWTLGEVATDPAGVVAALGRAAAGHPGFQESQVVAAATALGPVDPGVPDRAADAMLAALARVR